MADESPKSPGYRRPPDQHKFKSGQSGNPKGRPPKQKPQASVSFEGGGVNNRIAAMVLSEGMRLIDVREGDRIERIPAAKAVMRAMFLGAARNDAKAQRLLMDLLTSAESARAACATEKLVEAIKYQEKTLDLIERHRLKGLPPPNIYPHPYDVLINERTGEVDIDGPLTKDQYGAQLAILKDAFLKTIKYEAVEKKLLKNPGNSKLEKQLRELAPAKEIFEDFTRRRIRHLAMERANAAVDDLAQNKPVEPSKSEADSS